MVIAVVASGRVGGDVAGSVPSRPHRVVSQVAVIPGGLVTARVALPVTPCGAIVTRRVLVCGGAAQGFAVATGVATAAAATLIVIVGQLPPSGTRIGIRCELFAIAAFCALERASEALSVTRSMA